MFGNRLIFKMLFGSAKKENMTLCNRLNSAIVSQILKEYKKIKIMAYAYITDSQVFIPPLIKYRAKPGRTLNFIKPLRRSPSPPRRDPFGKGMPLAWTEYADPKDSLGRNAKDSPQIIKRGRDAMHRVSTITHKHLNA